MAGVEGSGGQGGEYGEEVDHVEEFQLDWNEKKQSLEFETGFSHIEDHKYKLY